MRTQKYSSVGPTADASRLTVAEFTCPVFYEDNKNKNAQASSGSKTPSKKIRYKIVKMLEIKNEERRSVEKRCFKNHTMEPRPV